MNDISVIAHWPDKLESLVERIGPPLRQCRVIAECASTQDQARPLGLGAVVLAGRQTAGRGQRGNEWADTGDGGRCGQRRRPERGDGGFGRDLGSHRHR